MAVGILLGLGIAILSFSIFGAYNLYKINKSIYSPKVEGECKLRLIYGGLSE